jgi:hypothetical protein
MQAQALAAKMSQPGTSERAWKLKGAGAAGTAAGAEESSEADAAAAAAELAQKSASRATTSAFWLCCSSK